MFVSLRALLLIVALLAGSIALACGDSGDDGGQTEPTTVDEASDQEDKNGDDEPAGDAESELRRLAEEFGISEYKVAYNVTSEGDGEETTESQVTVYWKPPDSSRVDLNAGESSYISSGGSSYQCSQSECQELPSGLATLPLPFLGFFFEPDGLQNLVDVALLGVDLETSDRSIAGENASCYSASTTVAGVTGGFETCLADDGLLLVFESGASGVAGAGSYRIEAISVERSVSDIDFEPPYEVTEFPDIGDIPDLGDIPDAP